MYQLVTWILVVRNLNDGFVAEIPELKSWRIFCLLIGYLQNLQKK